MSNLRRYDPDGRPVFVTCVTFERQPILIELIRPLIAAYRHIQSTGVGIVAWTVLPDHLHAIIELNDASLSGTIHRFKRKLSVTCYQQGLTGRIWQHRFWDHIIRDDSDFRRHIDYIHFNAVKHRAVSNPWDWKWSSIRQWLSAEAYTPDSTAADREEETDFGE